MTSSPSYPMITCTLNPPEFYMLALNNPDRSKPIEPGWPVVHGLIITVLHLLLK